MGNHHLSVAVRGRQAVARNEAERRRIVRGLARAGGTRILAFGLVDEHLHVAGRDRRPGYLARDLTNVLRRVRPGLEFKRPHIEPVESRPYLHSVVDYILRQPQKHGLPGYPGLWSGSCFLDLVGARRLPGFDPRALLSELPRFRLRRAFQIVGLEGVQLAPADDAALQRAGVVRLAELAASVLGLGPELTELPRDRATVSLRTLVANACEIARVAPTDVARVLGIQPRAVRRLGRRRPAPGDLAALRRLLALEERLGPHGSRPHR